MHISKKVRIAGGVLAAGSLLLVAIAGQASARGPIRGGTGGASGGSSGGGGGGGSAEPCGAYYDGLGYSCGTTTSPASGAILIHVKLRGQLHELDFALNAKNSNAVEAIDLQRENSENIWFDPTQYSGGSVTWAGNSTVNFGNGQNQCYFEDKHGNLAWASSGSDCTPN